MARLTLALTAVLLFLSACGEDNDSDDLPNILTGVSGVVVVLVLVWLLMRRRRR